MEGSVGGSEFLNRAMVYFHNTLHGIRTGIVTKTASLEAKLLQKQMSMRKEVYARHRRNKWVNVNPFQGPILKNDKNLL